MSKGFKQDPLLCSKQDRQFYVGYECERKEEANTSTMTDNQFEIFKQNIKLYLAEKEKKLHDEIKKLKETQGKTKSENKRKRIRHFK